MKLGFLDPRKKRFGRFLARLKGKPLRSPWVRLPWSIAVGSGKGGTGKTVIAANLSTQLSMDGHKVVVFDADLGIANIHLLLDVQATRNVAQVLSGRASLREAALPSPFGPRVVPGGSGISDLASLSAHELLRLAEDFRALEEGMDFLILDCAAGISVQTVLFLQAADDVMIVTNPDFTAMTDAYALIKVLHQRDPGSRVHILVNRIRIPSQAVEVFERLQGVCMRFLGKRLFFLGGIEEDDAVPRSVASRMPFTIGDPESKAAKSLRKVKENLLATGGPRDQEAGGARREGYGERLRKVLRF